MADQHISKYGGDHCVFLDDLALPGINLAEFCSLIRHFVDFLVSGDVVGAGDPRMDCIFGFLPFKVCRGPSDVEKAWRPFSNVMVYAPP